MTPLNLLARCGLAILLSGLLTACSGPGYYLQAISGQWKLMRAREDIQTLLDNPATPPELAGQLELANRIKDFARQSLDLPSDGSYSSYVAVEGEALVWNVVATEEFSLEAKKWCFPVAGCVPYRGYFKQHRAEASAQKLSARGMDVFVSPAAAYSSLGWFNDPLLSTMLSGPDTRLAAYLFHELAHQRLYIRDDGRFNESYASFVEELGLKAWLKAFDRQADIEQWQQRRQAASDFSALVKRLRKQLSELYASEQAEPVLRESKAALFGSFKGWLDELRQRNWQGKRYFADWSDGTLNNARLALYNTYEGSRCAFLQLWFEAEKDIKTFHALAEQKSGLSKQDRANWLNQSCTGVASTSDL